MSGIFTTLTILGIIVVVAAVAGIGWFLYMKARFKTATSNQALIITGTKLYNPKDVDENGMPKDKSIYIDENGRSMKIIRGGGHRLKMFQTYSKVDLKSFNLTVQSSKAYSKDAIPLKVTATAVISVGEDKKTIARYAEKYLGKSDKEIQQELTDVLEGYLRAIISTLNAKDAYQNYEEVNKGVRKIAVPALHELGFDLSFSIKKIEDDASREDGGLGYIEALGQPQIEKVRKEAEIAKSENEKETKIQKAEDNRQAEEAIINNERQVARIRKEKDLEESQIKEETERAKAKAEQSYNLEKTRLEKEIQEEQLKLQRRRKEEELELIRIEKERSVEFEQTESQRRKEKADADFYESTKRAEAEAKKSQIEGETKAKIEEQQGLAQAKIQREKGLAEADVIRQKGIAEAEAKRLLAEAISQYGEVVIIEKLIEMLPQYAKEIAAPLSNIDTVKIIDTGSGEGVAGYTKGITSTMAQIQEPLKEITGLDVAKILTDLVNRGNTHTVVQTPVLVEKETVQETKEEVVEEVNNS